MVELTQEETAAALSFQEGRTVTVQEVRQIECQALRKLRRELLRRGLHDADLSPSSDRWQWWWSS